MTLIDAHTHRLSPDALVSRGPGDEMPSGFTYSVGIHPWEASREAFAWVAETARRSDVAAIGETGLDLLRGPSLQIQQELLISHVELSERLHRPLVLHCVRAAHLLLELRKRLRPTLPWMIHSFRGKPAQAQQLIRAGFYLSIGSRFNPASLPAIPLDRLLIETDDSDTDIASVCAHVADALAIPTDRLTALASTNLTTFLLPL